MLIKPKADLTEASVAPHSVWKERRRLIKAAAAGGGLLLSRPSEAFWGLFDDEPEAEKVIRRVPIKGIRPSPLSTQESLTEYRHVTSYNNFLELGSGKKAPAQHADAFKARPWQIKVDGECAKPGEIDIEDILSGFTQEERIYRFRCVEAWYMVVPWVGFSLAELLKRFEPSSKAKYVAFETLFDPDQLPGQSRGGRIDWPYREGLRIDEAMHPLTLLATGLYGELLPNQNGAPLRLVVPWKYGYKSIKSIVRIQFTEREPPTTWNQMQPGEYGFYSNVNPEVDHPRWSQKTHRVLGAGWLEPEEETLKFNGYGAQVASLYSGMDLKKYS